MPARRAIEALTADAPRQRGARGKVQRSPRVGRSRTGLGVYARQRYQPAEIIGEIEGQIIDDPEYSSRYCMDLGDARCLEPAEPFRFVNHSCDPNCTFEWFDIRSASDGELRRRVFLLARTPIAVGEQLTIDYNWPPAMAIRCQCGEKICRGWIVEGTAAEALPGPQEIHG